MEPSEIIQLITDRFEGVDVLTPDEGIAAGDSFFYYDPERNIDPQGKWPFATIVTKDYGEYDNASQLDRPGVFRLNLGVSQATFKSLFGPRRAAGEADPEQAPADAEQD